MITYRQLLKNGEAVLKNALKEDYSYDALQLMLHSTGFSHNDFLMLAGNIASEAHTELFMSCIRRRKASEPLQYIIGKWSFFDSEFYVGEGVLIPRPETEELTGYCADFIKNNNSRVVYDLCTGSGCIGLSLAKMFPETSFYLFDLYDKALFYANKNLSCMKLSNVKIVKCDVTEGYDNLVPSADVIVSNPPYINSDEIKTLQPEVQREPHTALDGGADGLMFYRAIRSLWLKKLNLGGLVAVECGENQTDSIVDCFSDLCQCEVIYDMFNTDRFVTGIKNKEEK